MSQWHPEESVNVRWIWGGLVCSLHSHTHTHMYALRQTDTLTQTHTHKQTHTKAFAAFVVRHSTVKIKILHGENHHFWLNISKARLQMLASSKGTLRKKGTQPTKYFTYSYIFRFHLSLEYKKISHNGWPSVFFLSDGGLVVLFEKQGQRRNQISEQSCDFLSCSKTASPNPPIN